MTKNKKLDWNKEKNNLSNKMAHSPNTQTMIYNKKFNDIKNILSEDENNE
jgi:hypothetical protein